MDGGFASYFIGMEPFPGDQEFPTGLICRTCAELLTAQGRESWRGAGQLPAGDLSYRS
jgi:hypothetical protein